MNESKPNFIEAQCVAKGMRMTVDGWDVDRASTEAAALGLSNAALKTFAIDYVAAHKK